MTLNYDNFELNMEIGNAEMSEPEHVAEALVRIANKVAEGFREGGVRDNNGNTVGSWRFT